MVWRLGPQLKLRSIHQENLRVGCNSNAIETGIKEKQEDHIKACSYRGKATDIERFDLNVHP